MKVEKINKIMIIQWNDDMIRSDLGIQEVDVDEVIKILEKVIEVIKKDYGISNTN